MEERRRRVSAVVDWVLGEAVPRRIRGILRDGYDRAWRLR